MSMQWGIQEPYYHEDQTDPNHPFYMNRYNRRHLYIQLNTANNAIFQAGDYQGLNVPSRQWIYWPYPETFQVKQILPTYPITIASFASDEVISELGRYGEGYQDYARAQQAFHNWNSGAAPVGNYIAIQIGTPVNCQANIILNNAWIDAPSAPSSIIVTQGTVSDTNLAPIVTSFNHRTDGVVNGISPLALISGSSNTTTTGANAVVAQYPGANLTDLLRGTIREIPKLGSQFIGIYVKSSSATVASYINIDWYEERI